MTVRHPIGVLHSFSIKNTFYDKMDVRLFYFDEANYAHSLRRNQETTWFRVLKFIFVKRIVQRIILNYCMPFNLNDLSFRALKSEPENVKRG